MTFLKNSINVILIIIMPFDGLFSYYRMSDPPGNQQQVLCLGPRIMINNVIGNFVGVSSQIDIREIFGSWDISRICDSPLIKKEITRLDGIADGIGWGEERHQPVITVGSHVRDVLRVLDDLELSRDGEIDRLQNIYKRHIGLGIKWIDRLVAIHHDVGKGIKSDYILGHPALGGDRVRMLMSEWGLAEDSQEARIIQWVISHHHLMDYFINWTEYDESEVLDFLFFLEPLSAVDARLAIEVLTLVSFADKVSSGQLKSEADRREYIQRLSYFNDQIQSALSQNGTLARSNAKKKELLAGISSQIPENILNLLIELAPTFAQHNSGTIKQWIAMLSASEESTQVEPRLEARMLRDYYEMFAEISIVMKESPSIGFLARFAAALYLNGFDIQYASINTSREGVILDRFLTYFNAQLVNDISLVRATEMLRDDMVFLFRGEGTFRQLWERHRKESVLRGKEIAANKFPSVIHFEQLASATRMNIKTVDRMGLIFVVALVLSKEFRVNIEKVNIRTTSLLVNDYFILTTEDGNPLPNWLQKQIEQRLISLLDLSEIQLHPMPGFHKSDISERIENSI